MILDRIFPLVVGILVWSLTIFIEVIFVPIVFLRRFKKSKKCPPVNNDLLLLSATELAERIRKKQTSSVDVVQAYISRINEVNSIINAVIENRFEEALKDAQKADEIVNSGLEEEHLKIKYPLLGVPITIKGSIGVEGLIHTTGRVDIHSTATSDAVVVKYVKEAGAIPLLISNVPELCLNWESTNKLIGTTKNPYDTNRTSAGSSGGEASLMGCGASVIGIGSDICGSLRLPAHCCGVWGHKPSPYVVSNVGHYPNSTDKERWPKFFTLGPMARYCRDLKPLLNIIMETEMKNVLKLDQQVNVKKIKFYYMDDPRSFLANPFEEDVIKAVEKVLNHFDIVCDTKSTKIKLPLMRYCSELSFLPMLFIEGIEGIFDGKEPKEFQELVKWVFGRSDHEFTSILFEILNRHTPKIFEKFMKKVYDGVEKLRNDFIKILGDDGVFIFPTSTSEATYHGDSIRRVFSSAYLSIFNSLGFPATNCPVTFSKNGLPIGVQVVAAPNLDRLTLSVAEEIERAFGGWRFS